VDCRWRWRCGRVDGAAPRPSAAHDTGHRRLPSPGCAVPCPWGARGWGWGWGYTLFGPATPTASPSFNISRVPWTNWRPGSGCPSAQELEAQARGTGGVTPFHQQPCLFVPDFPCFSRDLSSLLCTGINLLLSHPFSCTYFHLTCCLTFVIFASPYLPLCVLNGARHTSHCCCREGASMHSNAFCITTATVQETHKGHG
jgi:hypothetical protein